MAEVPPVQPVPAWWDAPVLWDAGPLTPAEQLACDEASLRVAETTRQPALRIWELETWVVVLGNSNSAAHDVALDACRRDGVPLLRRCSGGGTVVLGPGCLAYSLVVPLPPDPRSKGIIEVAGALMRPLRDGLAQVADGIELCGTSDLARRGRKFSGNSQRWLGHMLLHHGTLLYDFDLPRISRYLLTPDRQPDYRAERPHSDFVANFPGKRADLVRTVAAAWSAHAGAGPDVADRIVELTDSRYSRDEWTLRR